MLNNKKGYFYETEENAVVEYIKSDCEQERNAIFNNKLKYPFTKMIESIIRRYNLQIPNEPFEDTFNDVMSFLFTKISNYNTDKNAKAYSYCGTICKNYLIFRKNQMIKMRSKCAYVESIEDSYDDDIRYSTLDTHTTTTPLIDEIIYKMSNAIDALVNSNFKYKKISENEIKIGFAIKEILNQWEDLLKKSGGNKLTKSIVLYFIREHTMLPTKDITIGLKRYKLLYNKIKNDILK